MSVGQALRIGDGFYHLCADDCGGEGGNSGLYRSCGLGYLLHKCKCKTNLFIAQV
jgi:hypothetical protein